MKQARSKQAQASSQAANQSSPTNPMQPIQFTLHSLSVDHPSERLSPVFLLAWPPRLSFDHPPWPHHPRSVALATLRSSHSSRSLTTTMLATLATSTMVRRPPTLTVIPSRVRPRVAHALSHITPRSTMLRAADISLRMTPEAICELPRPLRDLRSLTSVSISSPVYEYPLNGQWIMMDCDDGYILWTGIWKALGNHKGWSSPARPQPPSVLKRI